MRHPYVIERGLRFPDAPMPLVGFRKHVITTRQLLLINQHYDQRASEYGHQHYAVVRSA